MSKRFRIFAGRKNGNFVTFLVTQICFLICKQMVHKMLHTMSWIVIIFANIYGQNNKKRINSVTINAFRTILTIKLFLHRQHRKTKTIFAGAGNVTCLLLQGEIHRCSPKSHPYASGRSGCPTGTNRCTSTCITMESVRMSS